MNTSAVSHLFEFCGGNPRNRRRWMLSDGTREAARCAIGTGLHRCSFVCLLVGFDRQWGFKRWRRDNTLPNALPHPNRQKSLLNTVETFWSSASGCYIFTCSSSSATSFSFRGAFDTTSCSSLQACP